MIELLVVISIIALLIALLLPALGQTKEAGRNVRCMSGERQLALATLAYMNDYGYFPACYIPDVQGGGEAIGRPDPNYIFDRADEWGNTREVVGRWPALLMPYVQDTDAFRCSVELFKIPVNTYAANNVFWGVTDRGVCVTSAPFLPEPSQIDNIAHPANVVMFHESTRDWTGSLSHWILEGDLTWWGDYRGNFHYATERSAWKFSGGRHFRTPSSVGRDPWGKQNIAMVDGHVRTNVSMQWLVDNERPGVFHSYPFRLENEWYDIGRGYFNFSYELISEDNRDVGMEFWMLPWW